MKEKGATGVFKRGYITKSHMNEEAKRKFEEELMEEAARLMGEVNSDVELNDVVAPPDMRDHIFSVIRAKEAGYVRDELSAEEEELIRLGKVYKRKRKNRKYLLLAAVLVLTMACGVTSMGGPQKVYEKVTWMLAGRKQTNVDSDSENVVPQIDISEEEVYEEIEEKYGFYPVRLNYLPEGVEFQEVSFGEEIQGINIVYGKKDGATILYVIRPNYTESSFVQDVEDEFVAEYEIDVEETLIGVKQYCTENEIMRWNIQFEYNDISYFMLMSDIEKDEVDKIIENLFFF